VPDAPMMELSLDQQDEEMDEVPLFREDLEFMDHFNLIFPSAGTKVGSVSWGLAGSTHAQTAPEPLKNHWGHKPLILIDNLELIDFPANILEQADAAQLLFMKEVMFQAPPTQLTVVKLTTDPCTLAQYDGLVATAVVDKGKQQAVPTIKDDSNYGQSHLAEEKEAKEGEMAAQCFQHMQCNKKLAKKKANRAKNAVALAHRAQNNFSGRIPNGLGVKV
ncbi:hypothetical protein C0992_008848, partial [Termitomyces sp. T32_za158]